MKSFNEKEMKINHGLARTAARTCLRTLRVWLRRMFPPKQSFFGASTLACLGMLLGGAANAATDKSAAFPLDLIEGDRVSAGTEELTFSNLWDGDAEATVTIEQDGAAIYEGLSGEGVKTWTVDRNGRYVLTHTTYTNGVAGKVETAVFVV